MKREYSFLLLIFIMLYLLYLIIDYKYKEYKVNSHITYLKEINQSISDEINNNKQILDYLNSKAFKDKTLKEEQWLKNPWENVIFITDEENYNKYTTKNTDTMKSIILKEKNVYDSMTIFQKWVYFLFKKDIR